MEEDQVALNPCDLMWVSHAIADGGRALPPCVHA